MRPTLLLIPALALTACSTPRESCIYQANEQLRALEYKIETAQGNVDRGYAISSTTSTREIEATCSRELQDGSLETYDCALLSATNSAEQQCRAIHPE